MTLANDRRKFLLGSAAAIASAGSGAAAEKEVRAGFIGVGVRGGSLLRQTLTQDNVKVSAICDIDAVTRDQGLSAAGRDNPKSFTEWRKVIDLKDVDVVFVAAPCYLHAQMAAAALQAGKYVYCEKPLGITPEQVDLVLKAAQRSKAFLQIGQQLRYFPAMQEAIRQIHEGTLLGRSYVVKAHRHGGRTRPSATPAEVSPQQKTRTEWYADVKRSGDLIVENAIHNIDACNWIVNSRPVSAYGHGKKYFPQPVPPGTVMMDGFSVEYIYENDMHCDYSQLAFHPRHLKTLPSGMWYTVFGEKGSVYLTHDSATFYDLYAESEPRNMLTSMQQPTQKRSGEGDTAISDFYACVRENRQPSAGIKVAAVAALTAIMGREAIYKKRSVSWNELGVTV
ncbi:MAG TPA: Gfo/Idh/MocA family oxidoreductase [Bryobacteraceae bacterium]|nr:Gfo/Idh/MocA family oxidoreductase [Bryobacteraceae bacterium]